MAGYRRGISGRGWTGSAAAGRYELDQDPQLDENSWNTGTRTPYSPTQTPPGASGGGVGSRGHVTVR